MAEKTIAEMESDLAAVDAQMATLREEKEEKVAQLRALARRRDAIVEPLERARAATRNVPAQEIGL